MEYCYQSICWFILNVAQHIGGGKILETVDLFSRNREGYDKPRFPN